MDLELFLISREPLGVYTANLVVIYDAFLQRWSYSSAATNKEETFV